VRHVVCAIIALLLSLAASHQAAAEEWVDRVVRYQHCVQDGYGCRGFDRPRQYYPRERYRAYRDRPDREYRRERRRPDYEYSRRDDDHRCKSKIVEAVGFEYANVDRALKSTQLVYAATVRMEFGELYQQIEYARDVRQVCTDASVNDTTIGKLGETMFGDAAVLKRCKIWARPCRPEIERASFSKDESRRDDVRDDPPARSEREPPKKKRWINRLLRRQQ
jgi:hypothetical protein